MNEQQVEIAVEVIVFIVALGLMIWNVAFLLYYAENPQIQDRYGSQFAGSNRSEGACWGLFFLCGLLYPFCLAGMAVWFWG